MTNAPQIQLFKAHVTEEAIAAVAAVLRSGWIGLGPMTEAFEREFARMVGCKHAIALNSATSALHLAMLVSGVGPGDEVISTSLTFVSTNHAIRYCGAEPVFCDVDPATMGLDLARAAELVGPKTKAIVVVHYGGNPVDPEALHAFGKRHGIAVIEDAAHACGASFKGRRIGSFGLTCFSFHAVKNLPTGDGGMITTDDDELCARLHRLRWLGIDRSTFSRAAGTYHWEYEVPDLGFKYHMNDITAAIGLAHLPQLDAWNDRRRAMCARYRAQLADLPAERLRFVATTPGAVSAWHLCAVLIADRDQVVSRMRDLGIGLGVHYLPNHLFPQYATARRGDLTATTAAAARLASLPLHLGLSDADIDTVCTHLRASLSGA